MLAMLCDASGFHMWRRAQVIDEIREELEGWAKEDRWKARGITEQVENEKGYQWAY